MKRTVLAFAVLMFVVSTPALTGTAFAQDSAISVVTLDEDTFVTVQKTGAGEMISLYEVKGEKVYLVDVVINSTSRDVNLPKRYTHHIEIDNR